MLKSFSELYKLDITQYVDTRKGKDERGQVVDIPYLNWAKCLVLLHDNGAENVDYSPVANENGSYLFESKQTENKDHRKNGCYFVKVDVTIDNLKFRVDYPLMNGNLVVFEDTLNQLRISNAHQRAFVKGVAIHTGLGLSLWAKDFEDNSTGEDLSIHRADAIKERIQQSITARLKNGWQQDELFKKIGITEKQYRLMIAALDSSIAFERDLREL